MKKHFILKFVLVCISLCISLNARTQTRASLPSSFNPTTAPTGEVRFPAEFEPVQAVVIAHYDTEGNLPVRFIKAMAQEVKVITLVNTKQSTQTPGFTTDQVRDIYANGGLTESELANCEFIETPLDGRWTRDYAPWIVFNGTTPAIVDNIYNRVYTGTNNKSQTDDDNISNVLYNKWKSEYPNLGLYGMPVVHTGGNMMQDGYGNGVSDDIVYSESYKYLGLSEDEVDQKMKDYLGIDPYHVTIDPQGDYVAHVDCWGKFLAPDKILLAKVHQDHPRAKEYQQVANYFENTNCCWGYPYKVHYVNLPAGVETNSTVMAPYTNSLILNKKVFVPIDSNVGGSYNSDAIALYESLMPGYTIIPFECTNSDKNAGWYGWYNTDALHCRTHEVMDFNMLFVDHRDVLWGKQENQASYPISAKFIAYSGNAITETKLHYSTDNGSTYTPVDMQQVGTTDEYTADIPGNHQEGTVIKYYITGKDASGRECVQPTFGKDEPHEFEVGTPEAIQPSTEAITLTADKTTIIANGTDAITFTAMQGTTDITLLAKYYIDEEKIRSPYKTTTAGTYDVYAKYNGIESNRITITVEAKPILADNVVQITGDNVVTNKYIPTACAQKWAITQQYYLKDEIGKTGTIDKIAFKTANVDETYPFTRNLMIYMVETESSDFGTNRTLIAMSSESNVFSGEVTFSSKDSWVSIDITDFEYTGKNILICVNDVTGTGISGRSFDVISCSNNRSIYQYNSSSASAYDATTAIAGKAFVKAVPFLQLTFKTDSTPEPLVLKADKTTFTANGTDAVTFTVTQGSGTNETEVTNDCEIWYTIGTSAAVKITGNTFSTTTAGEYTFYAKKGTLTSDPITITAEAPAVIKPEIDLTKYYRIKVNSGEFVNQYLHISNTANTVITNAKANDLAQIFKIEDAGNGNYYLKSANGLYIKCNTADLWWNIYGNATNKTPLLFEYDNETEFYIRDYDKITGASVSTNNGSDSAKSYFKVENGTVYCDAPKTLAEVVTWVIEETELPLFLTADKETITANGTDVVTFTVKQGNDAVNDATIYVNGNAQTEYTFSTATAGDYIVYAKWGNLTSESITITTEAEQQGGDDNTGGDVVEITGNGETSMYVPIFNNENFAITQQIYTKDEIGKNDGGTITSIAFKTANNDNVKYPYTRTIDVYMANIDDSNFGATSTSVGRTMKTLSNENLVFSGNITFDQKDKWIVIDLTYDFSYNGSKNLLVCVNDYTDDYVKQPNYSKFATFTSFDNLGGDNGYAYRALYKGNHTTNGKYNPNNSITSCSTSKEVPFIQLTFGDAGTTPDQPEPEKPTISVVDNKTRFTADNSDYVTFTVTPEDAEIWYTAGTDTYQLTAEDNKSFKTSNAGTYSFFAKKDDLTSDPIEVVAVAENELVLTLSTNTIIANGINEVTFTVTQVDVNDVTQDVTNKCTFKINGTAITGNTFFTNRAGDYTVTATKGNKTATAPLTATALSGKENVVLIDGNVMQPAVNTTNTTVPVCNYDKYGISQQYYKASEIGKNENGIISHISFKTAKNSGTYSRNIKIYMVNTDESDFGETGKTTKPMSEDKDLVFSGNVNFTPNTWVTIELTNKFTYTANKNILVCVNDITSNNVNPISSYFDTYAKGYNDNFRTLYKNNTENAFDPTAEITNCSRVEFTPFVKFTFEKEQEVITLEASKTLIKADDVDYVSFDVQKEGLNPENVTEESEIHILREGDQAETVLDNTTGFEFTATVAGNYTAYAKKGEAISNTVNFRAVYPIEITASTDTIVADNVDFVTFTVKQSTGLGSEPIDITNAATIFVDNTPLGVGVNTFKTDIIDTYFVYAEYDGINSNVVTFFAKSHINYDEDIEGSLDGEYFNPKGYVTYNKGEDNEYTLVARKEDGKAIIIEDNVWTFGTGTGLSIELKRPNPYKPQADATLIIPEKILFDDNWVTVTEIEDYAFDTLFEYRNYNDFNPGDPLNKHFTNLIIPSTIEKVGTYTFGFPVETSIICFAPVPPEVTGYPPFLKDTYKNAILYVPAPYVDAYKEAKGWGVPTDEADKDAYFLKILPIETPTFYIAGSWDNEDNWVQEYGYPDPGEDVIILEDARIEDGTIADVGRVDIISGSITIADGGQLIHTNPGVSVTLEKEIIGYHGNTSPTSWYTISSPLYPSIESSTVENLLTNDFDLYRYDEPTHYWDNIEDLLDTIDEGPKGNWTKLDAARGYLYANNNDVTLKFKGVANHTGGTYNLTRDVWDGVLIGFHLVGNPFTHDIYMNNAFNTDAALASGYYILSSTGAWSANLGNDKAIEPCQGVLIKAISEGTLTINKKVGPAAQTRNKASDEFLTISVSNKNYEDKAYVLFSTEYPLEKVNHQNKDIPMVYIPMEEDNYAIATMGNDVKEIPVSFEAKTMGQYTISVKAQNYDAKEMYLVDRMTGIETNLLLEDYTFMATTTDNHERFIITMSTDVDTNENFIFINNGEMIINNIEGRGVLQIFDVMGRYISHTEVSGSANISTEEFTSGVYIIRMIDDNGIKTQKVVL